MNLTLSLGIDGGAAAAAKKRKVVADSGFDDVGGGAMFMRGGDGGDRGGRVARVFQARDRMVKEAEVFYHGDDDGMVETSDGGGGGSMELAHLLLSAVAAGEAGDVQAAGEALQEVYRRASCRGGDPGQRVAACYADALASRLAGICSTVRSLPAPPATLPEQLLAYTMFYQSSPFYQFAHFTANQAIVEAFEAAGPRRRLHVADFDVSYGFQWPSLIQSLSDAAAATSSSHDDDGGGDDGPVVSLRITGFGASADELSETEARLVRFAAGCPNLRFEFEGIVSGSNSHHERIRIDDDATVVVNLVFPVAQNGTTSSSEAYSATTMAYIHYLNPSMVFLIEKHDGRGGDDATGRSAACLLPRFAANLQYFAAVFDSLHECLPADSAERLTIERNHLGREISDAVASLDRRRHGGGDDHTASWKVMMESAGFEDVKLSSRTVSQAKLLLKMKSGCCGSGGGGFRVVEGDGGRAMSLAWRDMALATATCWRRRCR